MNLMISCVFCVNYDRIFCVFHGCLLYLDVCADDMMVSDDRDYDFLIYVDHKILCDIHDGDDDDAQRIGFDLDNDDWNDAEVLNVTEHSIAIYIRCQDNWMDLISWFETDDVWIMMVVKDHDSLISSMEGLDLVYFAVISSMLCWSLCYDDCHCCYYPVWL